MSVVTPQKQEKDDEVASSSIKRDIQRHNSAADEMIASIRNELFTPPGSSNAPSNDDLKSLYDDDGELGEEIQRLASIENTIRQDLNASNVDSIVMKGKKKAYAYGQTVNVTKEERSSLVFFALVVVWVVVYIKQWIEYNYPERIQK